MKIEIDKLLEKRMEEILQGTAEIVAETSVGYFQDTFRHKAFDGNPWAPPRVPKQSGSLLVQSGALLNSIRPVVVTPGRIVIAAGNEKWTMPGYTTKDSKVRLRFRPISGTRAGVIRAFGSTPEG